MSSIETTPPCRLMRAWRRETISSTRTISRSLERPMTISWNSSKGNSPPWYFPEMNRNASRVEDGLGGEPLESASRSGIVRLGGPSAGPNDRAPLSLGQYSRNDRHLGKLRSSCASCLLGVHGGDESWSSWLNRRHGRFVPTNNALFHFALARSHSRLTRARLWAEKQLQGGWRHPSRRPDAGWQARGRVRGALRKRRCFGQQHPWR